MPIAITPEIVKELKAMTPEKRRVELLYLLKERKDDSPESPELAWLKKTLEDTELRLARLSRLAADRERMPIPELYIGDAVEGDS